MIEFSVPGTPVAKGRPRFTSRGGGRTYTPSKTARHERVVASCARLAITSPLTGALRLEVLSYHPIPQGLSKATKQAAMLGTHRSATRPDADNVGKLVADALNGIGYRDDNQLVEIEVRKYYSEHPRTVVRLTVIE